ncbi:anti-sigma factor [Kribbella sp. CA-294648]|uniref:anti-sigma factor n=1 Tax=Kribbella sp. CA-294648 TaxID=3239948 RepID=UPI003D8CFDBD
MPILRSGSVWAAVPDGLEQRVLNELVSGVAAPSQPAEPRLESVPRARERRRIPRWTVLAVAAGVLVASGVGVMVLRPDPREVNLAAPGVAGGSVQATAEVHETPSGAEITLKTRGLRPAPPGHYYQGWLAGAAGSVTIGTFHLRDGTDDVVLWSGVAVRDYPRITVTLQIEGAGPQSSGVLVLRGQIPGSR